MNITAIDYSRAQTQGAAHQYYTAQASVESLLRSRVETLSRYKEVMSFQPFEQSDILREVLEDFCESMVDYTARAHFKLYNFLDDSKTHYTRLQTENMYADLVDNTQQLLDFHDKYNCDNAQLDCEKLKACLNQVGELLAERLLLEDRLIDAILLSWREINSSQ